MLFQTVDVNKLFLQYENRNFSYHFLEHAFWLQNDKEVKVLVHNGRVPKCGKVHEICL
jgi:hypothetical protein